jgi:D-tyrosyl-tRNA(Tyr) deacylase
LKALVQRVSRAKVWIEAECIASIETGAVVLLGVLRGDSAREAQALAERVARFRMFEDERGRMERSLLDVGGSALVVSQVTLAHCDLSRRKGRRPSFDLAAHPDLARPLCDSFGTALQVLGVPVSTGRFGARMQVELVNDGPVTFLFEAGSGAPPEGGNSTSAGVSQDQNLY